MRLQTSPQSIPEKEVIGKVLRNKDFARFERQVVFLPDLGAPSKPILLGRGFPLPLRPAPVQTEVQEPQTTRAASSTSTLLITNTTPSPPDTNRARSAKAKADPYPNISSIQSHFSHCQDYEGAFLHSHSRNGSRSALSRGQPEAIKTRVPHPRPGFGLGWEAFHPEPPRI